MSKKQNILNDLRKGIVVDISKDYLNERYGSSCRSRISELRQDGHKIESVVVDKPSGSLAYYMPEYKKARDDINQYIRNDIQCNLTIDDISSIYSEHDDWYDFKELDLVTAADLLQNGYVAI